MRNILLILPFLLSSFTAHSTQQIRDKIIYNGEICDVLNFPLEVYFEKYDNKPSFIQWTNTALWRGYVATYEIVDNQLFIKNIDIEKENNVWENIISKLFPDKLKVKMEWYSGLFVVPIGKCKDKYGILGYETKYDKYVILELQNGNIIKERAYTYKEYRKLMKNMYSSFKKTDNYLHLVISFMNQKFDDFVPIKKNVEDIIKRNIFDYVIRLPQEDK